MDFNRSNSIRDLVSLISSSQYATIKRTVLKNTPTQNKLILFVDLYTEFNITDLLIKDLEETMRIKTRAAIKVTLLMLLVVLVIAGCSGKKCEIDSDCGVASCSENQRKALNQICVDGRCEITTTECDDSEVCVADSLGVRCETADPDTGKARMSCSDNTDTFSIMGLNAYNPTIYICGDDCAADSYCTNECYCEEKAEISCSWNSDDAESRGENYFDQRTEMCGDDCPGGYDCNPQCICEERPRPPCPEPVLNTYYLRDAPPVDFDFDTISEVMFDDPGLLLDFGATINIPAYLHERDGVFYMIPFPEEQLTRVPFAGYVLQFGAYCVDDWYEGAKALDINLRWFIEPKRTCYWGPVESFEGVLTVCPETVIDWYIKRIEELDIDPLSDVN